MIDPSLLNDLAKIEVNKFYFIYIMDTDIMDSVKTREDFKKAGEALEDFKNILDKNKTPYDEIKNKSGKVLFRIYKVFEN